MAEIIAICGAKNSGKTTLITRLISELSVQGIKVAVIKHDGHDFECDIPGTDTYRFTESGAYGTACFSESRFFIHKLCTGTTANDLIRLFPEAELIIVEGLKDSTLPKIEAVRKDISDKAVSNPAGRFLIATDCENRFPDEQTADLNDIDAILESIRERMHL